MHIPSDAYTPVKRFIHYSILNDRRYQREIDVAMRAYRNRLNHV
jgi:hypothetical protein